MSHTVNTCTYRLGAYVRGFLLDTARYWSRIRDSDRLAIATVSPKARIPSRMRAICDRPVTAAFGFSWIPLPNNPVHLLIGLGIAGLIILGLAILFRMTLNDPTFEESSLEWQLGFFKLTGKRKRRH